jgi:hypothetical protein
MPVRGKRTRDATNRISLDVTGIFCGKLFRCPASDACQPIAPQEIRVKTRLSCNTPSQALWAHGGAAANAAALAQEESTAKAENKRPVRGDNRTGQSHMGAWGGWALAPNTADGEGIPLPRKISRAIPPDVQRPRHFFNFWSEGVLAENYRAAGRFGSPAADLSDAIAADGTLSSRLTETSLSDSPPLRGAVATGTGGVAVAAVVAANASASP